MSQNSGDNYDKILDDVTSYLRYLKQEGVREEEIDPARLRTDRKTPAVETRIPATSETKARFSMTDTVTPNSDLAAIAKRVSGCRNCPLHKDRTNTVPGQGSANPEIMFVGEGPGADEDAQGLAFVGRAGQLLTKIIEAMGYTREQVFIGNIVKCRPPGNRAPFPDEMQACLPYLKEQIAILKPKIIVALGATAVRGLTQLETGITKLRGKWLIYEGIELMPTYHPAYLLRNPAAKREVWEDMKTVLAKLGRKPPQR